MLLAQLLALLAPPACAACRAPLCRVDGLVCPPCLRELRWLGTRGCRRCALPHHGGRGCPASGAPHASAWAPVSYSGPARDLLRALKFHGALPVAGLLAAQIAANVPSWALGGAQAVVPVPPARGRHRRRGFDPAVLLAGELAQRLDLPLVECLHRSGRAPRQLGARRAQRRAPGRIGIAASGRVPTVALLVDDVHTTGATLRAAATALRAGGADRVHAVTYARVL